MRNCFHLWLCSVFCASVSFCEEGKSSSEQLLTGQVVKIEYPVPSFIANSPFGWYLKLDNVSQEKVRAFRDALAKNDQMLASEFDISIVRLDSLSIEWSENANESIRGHLWQTLPLDGPLCFLFDVQNEDRLGHRERCEIYPDFFSERKFPWLTDEQEQQEVELTGVVGFQIFPGPGNYCSIESGDGVERCWYLSVESARVPQEWKFPDLRKEKVCIGWVDDENLIDQKVTVRGTLFNAHTSHHHTSLLMDVKCLKK